MEPNRCSEVSGWPTSLAGKLEETMGVDKPSLHGTPAAEAGQGLWLPQIPSGRHSTDELYLGVLMTLLTPKYNYT